MKKISSKEVLFLVPGLIAMLLIAQASDAQTSFPQPLVDNSPQAKQLRFVQAQIEQQPLKVHCATVWNTRVGQNSDEFSYGYNPWTKTGAYASWSEDDFGFGDGFGSQQHKSLSVQQLLPLVKLAQTTLELKAPLLHVGYQNGAHGLDLVLKLAKAPQKGETVPAQLVRSTTDGKVNTAFFLTHCDVKMFW